MKAKSFFLVFTSLFLVSCNFPDNWYFSEKEEFIISKNETKPFSHLKDPIIVSLSYSQPANLFGIEQLGQKSKYGGRIFFIIDTQTKTAFDWAYYPCETGVKMEEPVKLGKDSTFYCDSGWNYEKIGFLEQSTGKIKTTNYEKASYFVTGSNYSNSGLLYHSTRKDNKDCMEIDFFDLKTKSIDMNHTLYFSIDEVWGDIIPCQDGNYIISQRTEEYNIINKIDVELKTSTKLLTIPQDFDHYVSTCLYEDNECYIVVSHNKHYYGSITDDDPLYTNKSLLEMYNKNNECIKTIEINYPDDDQSKIETIYSYNGKIYALARGVVPSKDTSKEMYYLDFNNNEYILLDRINLLYPKYYFAGSKLFLSVLEGHSGDGLLEYIYFDFETETFSTDSFSIDYEKAIRGE